MYCVGMRLKEGQPFGVEPEARLFFHAYRIPHRPAFIVLDPWWQVDIMTEGHRHSSVTLWEGDEQEIEVPLGIYQIRYDGMVKATPHELNVQSALLSYGGEANYPLRGSGRGQEDAGELTKGTTRVTGRSLNLAGLRAAFLHFQPIEVVRGKGRAEVTLEHSDDEKSWEPVPSGGFPGQKIIIDQEEPQSLNEQMMFGGIKQYVRWAYNPVDVLGWGARGQFFYETESLHRR